MFDVVIKGGLLYDGTGADGYPADVGISGSTIAAIGPDLEPAGCQVIDAKDRIVAPGFIDAHTHFDAQVTWDRALEPVASHGVTTVVMGNCGVGFAPVRSDDRDLLITVMEGVEDIPGAVLHDGIRWDWESFPEYLDALDRQRFSVDVAALVPHAALRLYAVGPARAGAAELSTEELGRMAQLVREAVEAGAFGLSTSRVVEHQAADGAAVPGTFAQEAELAVLKGALLQGGSGVLQVVPAGVLGASTTAQGQPRSLQQELEMLERLARHTDGPIVFSLFQSHDSPDTWRDALASNERAAARGAQLIPMVAPRAPGLFVSWATHHPFQQRPTYRAIAGQPLAERLAELRNPAVRARILAERDLPSGGRSVMANFHQVVQRLLPGMFAVGSPGEEEPEPTAAIASLAARAGKTVEEIAYDLLTDSAGTGLLTSRHRNYASGRYDAVEQMLSHRGTLCGLSDAGAHVRVICDASNPTFMLSFWGRDRTRGARLPLPLLIQKLAARNAEVFGLTDRGILRVGMRADINVIDLDRLASGTPRLVADLPCGGERFLQHASGYDATLVAGKVVRRWDTPTGAFPGRLLRNHSSS